MKKELKQKPKFLRDADLFIATAFPYFFGKGASGAAGDPFDVFDELDLEMNETQTGNNPLTLLGDLANDVSHEGDCHAMVDRSKGKAVLSTKASDFTVDEDGFTSANFTTTANETINGEGGYLKALGVSGTGQISIAVPAAYDLGTNYISIMRFKFKWAWSHNDTTIGNFYQYYPKVRRDFKVIDYAFGANHETEIFMLQQGVRNIGLTGASADRLGKGFYLKDFITELIDGNHFIQNTVSASPHRNTAAQTLDFDGVGMVLTSDTFGAGVASDSAGMFSMAFRDDDGTGTLRYLFTLFNGGIEYITFFIDAGDDFAIKFTDGGVNSVQIFDGANLNHGGWNKIQFGADGGEYLVYINGVAAAYVSGGANDGKWIDTLGKATFEARIAQGNGAAYCGMGLRQLGYTSGRALTAAEIAAINGTTTYTE